MLIEDLEGAVGWPPYSHVGMVIKDGESLYLWDAPGNGGNCFPDPYASDPDNRIHGTPVHNGCRVAALDDVLGYYATVVDQPFTLRQLAPAVSQDSFVALRRFITVTYSDLGSTPALVAPANAKSLRELRQLPPQP